MRRYEIYDPRDTESTFDILVALYYSMTEKLVPFKTITWKCNNNYPNTIKTAMTLGHEPDYFGYCDGRASALLPGAFAFVTAAYVLQ